MITLRVGHSRIDDPSVYVSVPSGLQAGALPLKPSSGPPFVEIVIVVASDWKRRPRSGSEWGSQAEPAPDTRRPSGERTKRHSSQLGASAGRGPGSSTALSRQSPSV
jgi:hypothetical protein